MDSNPRKKAIVPVDTRRRITKMGSSSTQINLGKPCDVCGDVGYAKDIVICSKCQIAREHTYCMNPNLFNVPKSWHCEACRCPGIGIPSQCRSEGHRTYLEKNLQDSFKRQKTWSAENVSSKIPDVKPATNRPHKNYVPKSGKVKFLPTEDVCALSSGAKSKPPPSQGGSFGTNHCHVPKKTAASASTKYFPLGNHACKSAKQPRPLTGDRLHKSTLNQQAVKRPQLTRALKSSPHFPFRSSTSENLNGVVVPAKESKKHISEAHHSQIDRIGNVVSGVQKPHHSENRLSVSDKHAGRMHSSLVKDCVFKEKAVDADKDEMANSKVLLKVGDEILLNPPAAKASWRRGFEIDNCNHGLNGEFQVYPPGKVSRKAYLVSKQMPDVLKFTLHPRRDVWPDAFHTDPPCGCDIALYFLVDDFCRSKEIYSPLLELIDKEDLSLRTCVDSAELLVFTSKLLPVESQRMNKQFYLWGVFASLRGRSSSPDWKGRQPAISYPLHPLGKDLCDDLDIPPGFSRSVNDLGFSKSITNNAAAEGSIVTPPIKSPVAHEVDNELDTPPGFSKFPTLKKKVSWSKELHRSEPCNNWRPNSSVQNKNWGDLR